MPGGHNQFDHIAFSSLEAPIVAPVEVATGTEPSAQQRGLRTMTGLTAILHEDIEEMPRPSGLTDEEYEAGVQHGQTFLDWVDLCVNVLIEGDAETNRQFTFADITELAVTAYGASLHRKLLQGQIARADYHSLTAIQPWPRWYATPLTKSPVPRPSRKRACSRRCRGK
jgi:hypothetical protein